MAEIAGNAYYRPGAEGVVRRLAPRSSRLELDHIVAVGELTVLLGAMGVETANVHRRSADAAAILGYLRGREEGWGGRGSEGDGEIDWYSGAGIARANNDVGGYSGGPATGVIPTLLGLSQCRVAEPRKFRLPLQVWKA